MGRIKHAISVCVKIKFPPFLVWHHSLFDGKGENIENNLKYYIIVYLSHKNIWSPSQIYFKLMTQIIPLTGSTSSKQCYIKCLRSLKEGGFRGQNPLLNMFKIIKNTIYILFWYHSTSLSIELLYYFQLNE